MIFFFRLFAFASLFVHIYSVGNFYSFSQYFDFFVQVDFDVAIEDYRRLDYREKLRSNGLKKVRIRDLVAHFHSDSAHREKKCVTDGAMADGRTDKPSTYS